MAEMQQSMESALDNLKGGARVENANKIRGDVRIINRDQIKALVEKFVAEFGTDRDMAAKLKAMDEELAKLKAELEAAATEKSGLQEKINDLERARAALEKELEEADLANLNKLKEERDQAVEERDVSNEKLSKLEAIMASDDLKERLKNLEYELIELKKAYHEAVIGLEFVDVIDEVDFAELTVQAKELEPKLDNYAVVKNRARFIGEQLNLDSAAYSKLVDTMEEGKGTIRVVVDIISLAVKCTGYKRELALAASLV